MSWIRYDDQFYGNPKVTAVIADDPAALSLHVLANTWSNGQKRPGFIPAHQPAVLILDRERAVAWAALLVKHDLWHDIKAMCVDCMAEYGDLGGEPGYVFHDHAKYRAPARDRTTPGTPAALSEKRRAAGRRGGAASAVGKRRQANEANEATSQANGQANRQANPDFAWPVTPHQDGVIVGATRGNTPTSHAGFGGVSKPGQQTASAANGAANVEANFGAAQANRQSGSDFATPSTPPSSPSQDGAASIATSQNTSTAQAGFAGVSKTSKPCEQDALCSHDGVSPEPVFKRSKDLKDSLKRADIGTDKDPDFTTFWAAYPRAGSGNSRPGKGQARTEWRKAVIANGADPKKIITAAGSAADFHAKACTEPRFIPHASTWLRGEGYNDAPEDTRERNFDF